MDELEADAISSVVVSSIRRVHKLIKFFFGRSGAELYRFLSGQTAQIGAGSLAGR
jgi:hypothetical protein